MKKEIINYKKKPSTLMTIWMAFMKRNIRFAKDQIQETTTLFPGTKINRKHLEAYCEACGVTVPETPSILYPLTLIYPFNIRLISSKNVPLVMFKMLNTHTTLTSYRKIAVDENIDISCTLSNYRILEKGLEVEIKSYLTASGSVVWECANTFYFRGKFSGDKKYSPKYVHEKIEKPDKTYEWVLPDKNGMKFAAISGDSNPLHYNQLYSKMMGFERDFAQPFLVSEKITELLGKKVEDRPVRVDLFYKGQVYYGKRQTIKSVDTGLATSFELFCEGNERPSIHGSIAELP